MSRTMCVQRLLVLFCDVVQCTKLLPQVARTLVLCVDHWTTRNYNIRIYSMNNTVSSCLLYLIGMGR